MKTTIEFDGDLIKTRMDVIYKQDGDQYVCYIPSFDFHFSTKSEERIDMCSKAMVEAFFKYYSSNLKELFYEFLKLVFAGEGEKVKKLYNKEIGESKNLGNMYSSREVAFEWNNYVKKQFESFV